MAPLFHYQPLQKGDTIGIVAPAGQLRDKTALERGITILHDMGFTVRFPRNLWPGDGYLADTDENRADEFHKMWADPAISALLALRGGYGCLRLLPFLDINEIGRHKKPLIGFSDITVLHQAFSQTDSVVSFHGPVLTSLASAGSSTLSRFHACLTGHWQRPITSPAIEVIRGGDLACGKLTGGNLSSIVSMLGTHYDENWQGRILFLEDTGEPLYRLDRLFTQLALSTKLDQVKGIVLGDFSLRSDQDRLEGLRFHEQVWNRVLQLTDHTGIPVWGDFPVGHSTTNMTLPCGADAVMDSSRRVLSFT